jgi:hypothetical protein
MHPVQLGGLFVSRVGAWGVFFVIRYFLSKKKILFIKNKLFDLILLLISCSGIYLFNNVFDRLFKKDLDYSYFKVSDFVTANNKEWSFLSMPQWKLFSFFDNYYIPMFLIIFSFLFIFYLIIHDKRNVSFLNFVFVSILLAIFLFEVGSSYLGDARLYFLQKFNSVTSLCIYF